MFVSLVGKFEQNSTKVVFKLAEKIWPSSVANLESITFSGSGIKLDLINFSYCDDPNHVDSHFPLPISLPYPSVQAYQATIRVRVPRPFRVSHRRSTIYFVPDLDLTTNTSDYEDRANAGVYVPQALPRSRRGITNESDNTIQYFAGFDKAFAMTSFTKPGPTSAIDFLGKLKSYQEGRINSAFGNLNLVNLNFVYERRAFLPDSVSYAAPDAHTRIDKIKVSVTIPPSMHIGFSDSRLWYALGFDSTDFQMEVFKPPDKQINFFGPSNIGSNVPKIITATHWITAKASLNVQLKVMALQQGKARLGDPLKDNVSLAGLRHPTKTDGSTALPLEICTPDTSYALTIYQTILKTITQELNLKSEALIAEDNKAEHTITLRMAAEPVPASSFTQNFKILILAGASANSKLGISELNPCLWFPADGPWKSGLVSVSDVTCNLTADTTSEDLTFHQSTPTRTPSPVFTSTPVPPPPPPQPDRENKRKPEESLLEAPPKKETRRTAPKRPLDESHEEAPGNKAVIRPASTNEDNESDEGESNQTAIEEAIASQDWAKKLAELEANKKIQEEEALRLATDLETKKKKLQDEDDQVTEEAKLAELEAKKKKLLEEVAEAARLAASEAARLAEMEAKKKTLEEEQKRAAELEAKKKKLQEEVEAARLADLEIKKKKAQEDANLTLLEAAKVSKLEAKKNRLEKEVAEAARLAELELKKKQAHEEAAEVARVTALEEKKKRLEETAAKLKELEAKKKAVEDALKKLAELEANNKAQEAQQLAELVAKKQAAEMELKRLANLELQQKADLEAQRIEQNLASEARKKFQEAQAQEELQSKKRIEEAQSRAAVEQIEAQKKIDAARKRAQEEELEALKKIEEAKKRAVEEELKTQQLVEAAKQRVIKEELAFQKQIADLKKQHQDQFEAQQKQHREEKKRLEETRNAAEEELKLIELKKKLNEEARKKTEQELRLAQQQKWQQEEELLKTQYEQARLLRAQEELRLNELKQQLALEADKLKQEAQRLAELEQERLLKEREADALKEKLQTEASELERQWLKQKQTIAEALQQQLLEEQERLKNINRDTIMHFHETQQETARLETDLEQTAPAEIAESLMDIDQHSEPGSQNFQTPESIEDQDALLPDDNAWDFLDIPNPNLAPPNTFEPVQNAPLGRCPVPTNFPQTCTLILLEGLNKDYCMERGFCSALGTIINADNGHKQIINNLCILQANEIEQLTLDIVDEHLNSFSPARPAFVKLDLKLYRLAKNIY